MAGANIDEERGRGARAQDEHPDNPIAHSDVDNLRMDDFSEDSSPPTPRFIQDQSSYRHLKWVPVPIRRVSAALTKWAKGPTPPHIHRIDPILPSIQEIPLRLLDQYVPKKRHRISLLVGYFFLWIVTFVFVMRQSQFATEIEGFGKPGRIGCTNTYWVPGNQCGMNGNNCRPFNGSSFAFRCPANCKSTWILNPRAVGAQNVNFRPLVIGGPSDDNKTPIYRSDSFICGSAIHAGIIDNEVGGCGVVTLVGGHRNYKSSKRHGIKSIGFDSEFPSSFSFHSATPCEAKDPRWQLFYVSLAFTIVFSLFVASPPLFFFSIYTGIFAHVGLASDPPYYNSTAGLVSNILGKYLPGTFCAFVIYRHMGVRRALTGLTAQMEKTVLWLGGCWFGALSNYTLDWIPIQRLTSHDLKQQPGAVTALIIIVSMLTAIVISQIFYFQREGRLIRYLALYGTFIAAILLSLTLPGLSLRIHHYILALLFLPGTSLQTRPSLLYQGILIGLFINGIARWGFDSVLQTPWELQGDAQHDSALPNITSPKVHMGPSVSTISFSWLPPPSPFDGISVLVNDVERFRGYTDEGLPSDEKFIWSRKAADEIPDYFRFAYMGGNQAWDYTKAGTWGVDGSWIEMEEGASSIAGNGSLGTVPEKLVLMRGTEDA